VQHLLLSAKVRGKDIRPGETEIRMGQVTQQLPEIGVIFFDENRVSIGEVSMGSWRGTFDWRSESKRIDVPGRTREAILRIGLFGATGELSIDQIEIAPAKK
jgi:protein-L-isoaspartate(D-aspartate) O-methyltransferase